MKGKILMEYGIGIVAIVKNEADYIEEWIRYHRIIGVEKFYIFNNDSTDRTEEILNDLTKEINITVINFPGEVKQIPAYNYAIKRFRKECKYLAFIDVDEFIHILEKTSLLLLIEKIIKTDRFAGGVAINWRMFGSSGYENKPEGLVIRNFNHRGRDNCPGNQCIKSIVNPRKVMLFHNPHYPIYFPIWHAIDENGNRVTKWENKVDRTNKIQINHYFTKSKEEWIIRRSRRRSDNGQIRPLDEFYKHDNNEILDESMIEYAEIIEEEMEKHKLSRTE